jgi:excisionase family DNA binding protein
MWLPLQIEFPLQVEERIVRWNKVFARVFDRPARELISTVRENEGVDLPRTVELPNELEGIESTNHGSLLPRRAKDERGRNMSEVLDERFIWRGFIDICARFRLKTVVVEDYPRHERSLCLLKTPNAPKSLEFWDSPTQYRRMLMLVRSIVSRLVCRCRSRAVLELENLALRHQLHVLRRQRPGRLRLFTFDRLLWVLLYRLWPRCLEVMVLVKPATAIQWHRLGFRLFWRWRSRSGRPSVEREIRDLIRQMSSANPLWGAPRIHGELLKLGIEVSQATVAKYMVRRRGTPSQNWRTFLRNQAEGIAAIDLFIVASTSFQLLYVMIILAHDRRKIMRTAVTEHPTAAWLSRQVTEAFPWDTVPRYLLRDRDASYGSDFRCRIKAMGITEVITAPRSPWHHPAGQRSFRGQHSGFAMTHIENRSNAHSIMTVGEVARFLRVHPSTIYKLLRRREIPGFKVGSDWRFIRESIGRWATEVSGSMVGAHPRSSPLAPTRRRSPTPSVPPTQSRPE